LSSYWVGLVTPVPSGIARPLIDGLRNEVIVTRPGPAKALGVAPMGYPDAVHRAIGRTTGDGPESTWFDAHAARSRRGDPPEALGSREGMMVDRRSVDTALEPGRLFAVVEAVGGASGWPYHLLWELRGLMDRVVGGVGMRLGRRDPARLRTGDALDFWRVEEVRRPELLRLRAEMRLPGRAWLQFEVLPVDGRDGATRLVQTAFFEPRGVLGLAYWYLLYPAHALIFRGMVHAIARRAAPVRNRCPD
jgi:hypothetical protein